MTWNKDNPRFRRSSFLGSRRKKSKGLLSRLGGHVNGLFGGGETQKGRSLRPHPSPPPELVEDLKIALPKAKKTSQNSLPFSVTKPVAKPIDAVSTESGMEMRPPSRVPEKNSVKEYSSPITQKPSKEEPKKVVNIGRENFERPKRIAIAPNGNRARTSQNQTQTEQVGDDFKINRLGKVRRRKLSPQRDEYMEAGLGCDPKNTTSESDICRPPRRPNGGTEGRERLKRNGDRARTPLPEAVDQNNVETAPKKQKDPAVVNLFKNGDSSHKSEGETQSALPPANSTERKLREKRLIKLAAVSFTLVLLVICLAVYLVVFKEPERPVAKVARLPQASLPKVPPIAPGFFEFYAVGLEDAIKTEVTIEAGGSLGKALEAVGLGSRQGVAALINYMSKDEIAPMVQPGDIIRAFWADRGKTELARLEYLPNPQIARADLTPLIIMRRADGGFWHYSPTPPLLTLSAAREATIDSSLWAAGSKVGLDAGIITSITEILASDIDFMTNIQRGDTFQVLYSRDYRDGRPKGEPIIDMIRLTNRNKSYEYYRYVSEGDKVSYYDPEGRSSAKAFFMTPLQYKRISSQFTMKRLHPIHKVVRPHQGVDYAAPQGTPVSSVADGTVIFCGWNGGYGKLVTIKHDDTYTTMYAHLSKFAPGLSKGSSVKQGDLIGFVGATGTATGPHLDFRMKKHGTFIDPLPVLAEQKGKELKPEDKQIFIEKVLTPLRDEMTKKLLASRDNF